MFGFNSRPLAKSQKALQLSLPDATRQSLILLLVASLVAKGKDYSPHQTLPIPGKKENCSRKQGETRRTKKLGYHITFFFFFGRKQDYKRKCFANLIFYGLQDYNLKSRWNLICNPVWSSGIPKRATTSGSEVGVPNCAMQFESHGLLEGLCFAILPQLESGFTSRVPRF